MMAFLWVVAFAFGFAAYNVSAQEKTGFVANIKGNKVSIIDNAGQKVIIANAETDRFAGLQPGDKVLIRNGEVMKEINATNVNTMSR